MVKNIVFDLGNVIVEFKPKDYMKRIGFSDEKSEEFFQMIFKDARWEKFDLGDITIDEYVAALKAENPDKTNDLDLIFPENWTENFLKPKQASIDFLNRASDTYGIYILSNVSSYVLEYVKSLGFWNKVNGGTYSYAEKSLKPEPKIYQNFLRANNLNPSECLFLDDLPQNIEAAKSLGLNGIVFHDNLDEVIDFLITDKSINKDKSDN